MMKFYEFKELNAAKGYHWFKPDTLRFFKSRMSNWDVITGYFISSERGPDNKRKFTIRRGDLETGTVSTIGQFQQYQSLRTAKTALRRLLQGK